jgi:hypothetical protein
LRGAIDLVTVLISPGIPSGPLLCDPQVPALPLFYHYKTFSLSILEFKYTPKRIFMQLGRFPRSEKVSQDTPDRALTAIKVADQCIPM